MTSDRISGRQAALLTAAALLAPATDLLPGRTAVIAGGAGWLAVLAALPILLAGVWALNGPGGGGFPSLLQNTLGRWLGGLIIILYMCWSLVLLAVALRLGGERLSAIYEDGPAFARAVLLLLLALWMGFGKAQALARAGTIFYFTLAAALAGVILLGAAQVEVPNLYPEAGEAAALPRAAAAAGGLLLACAPMAALQKGEEVGGERRRMLVRTIAASVVLTLLLAIIVGSLGPRLTARLPAPFLTMVQGLGIAGAFQRLEALFAALWALSDVVLAGALLTSWKTWAACLKPGKWTRWSIFPAAAAALAGAWIFLPQAEQARKFGGDILPVGGLFLGLILPLIIRIAAKVKKTGC